MVYNGKTLLKWVIWGVPLFSETPIYWHCLITPKMVRFNGKTLSKQHHVHKAPNFEWSAEAARVSIPCTPVNKITRPCGVPQILTWQFAGKSSVFFGFFSHRRYRHLHWLIHGCFSWIFIHGWNLSMSIVKLVFSEGHSLDILPWKLTYSLKNAGTGRQKNPFWNGPLFRLGGYPPYPGFQPPPG